jgi:hypothetical protein
MEEVMTSPRFTLDDLIDMIITLDSLDERTFAHMKPRYKAVIYKAKSATTSRSDGGVDVEASFYISPEDREKYGVDSNG